MHALRFHTPAILKRGKLLKERLNTAPQHLVNLNDPSLQSPSNQRLTTFPITLPAAPMGTPYQTRATAARKKRFLDRGHSSRPPCPRRARGQPTWLLCYCFVFPHSSGPGKMAGGCGGCGGSATPEPTLHQEGFHSWSRNEPTPERRACPEFLSRRAVRGQAWYITGGRKG